MIAAVFGSTQGSSSLRLEQTDVHRAQTTLCARNAGWGLNLSIAMVAIGGEAYRLRSPEDFEDRLIFVEIWLIFVEIWLIFVVGPAEGSGCETCLWRSRS